MPYFKEETPFQRVIVDENVCYFPCMITLFFEGGKCETYNFSASKEAADFLDKIRKPGCYKENIEEIILNYKVVGSGNKLKYISDYVCIDKDK